MRDLFPVETARLRQFSSLLPGLDRRIKLSSKCCELKDCPVKFYAKIPTIRGPSNFTEIYEEGERSDSSHEH